MTIPKWRTRMFNARLLVLALLLSGPANAADAVRGKVLYNSTPGGTSCANSSCHTANVAANRNKLLRGANNPALIQSAINNNTGGMGIYRNNVLTAADVADIAAFIGNPNVVAAPAAAVSPTSLTFASTTTGTSSATQTVTLSNTGSAALAVNGISFSSTDFIRSGGSCVAGGSVAAGGSCSIGVAFSPTTAGSKTGTLSITHNATGSPSSIGLSGTATAPAVAAPAVTPAALNFGAVNIGVQSANQSVTVSNSGTAAMQLSSIVSTNMVFGVSGGTCGAGTTVSAGGGSCTVSLWFTPASTGAASGTLNIVHSASASPLTVALSGSGTTPAAPLAQLAPTSLSYSQTVGTRSTAQTLTLSNTGIAPLTISTINLSGAAAVDYSLQPASTCSAGGTVAAGNSCSLAVTFTPGSTGSRNASLAITHSDAARSPSTASLAGNGTSAPQGQVSVNQLTLSYPAQAISTRSSSQTVRVTNSGSAALLLSSIGLSGAQAGDYAIDNSSSCNTSAAMAVGASCTVDVSFLPTASSGTRTASLTIASSSSSSSATVTLSGTASPPGRPAVSLSVNSLDFGSLTVGTSASRSVMLSNSGNAPLSLTALSATPTAYLLSSDCPTSLAMAASCTLTIRFTPNVASAISGTLTVLSDATTSPNTLALAGNGVAAVGLLGWQPASGLNYPDTAVGAVSASQTATLLNTGTASVLIRQVQVAGANASDFSPDAASNSCHDGQPLGVGVSCTVGLTFVPNAAGARGATLNVLADAGAPPALPLSGNGIAPGTPQLGLTPATITLSSAPNQPLQPEALVLSNDGNAVLHVTAITASSNLQALNASMPGGGTCPQPPFDLLPGLSCTVMVSPLQNQPVTGTVDVFSDSASPKSSVAVQGTPLANVGAGGCSIGRPDQPFDPIWLALLLTALAVLIHRHRQRH